MKKSTWAGRLVSSLPVILVKTSWGLAAGLASGLIVALLLGRWTWLEMRVNTSLAVPLFMCGSLLWSWWQGRGTTEPRKGRMWYLLLAQLVLAGVMFACFSTDWDAWAIMPASFLREGLLLTHMITLNLANGLLLVLLVAGNLGAWWQGKIRG